MRYKNVKYNYKVT